MEKFNLDFDEGIILEDTDVERYSGKECLSGEMILTNKNLLFIYDYKAGIFAKAEKRIEKRPLSDIKVVDGKVQIAKMEHDDYGDVIHILFTNGHREFYSFYDERKDIPRWISAICQAITESEPTFAEELQSKKESNLFSFGRKDKVVVNAEEIERPQAIDTTVRENIGATFCVNCGEKLERGTRFCSACGAKVNQIPQNNNQRQQEYVGKVYKCPNCGSVITNMTAVCPDCGMKISSDKDSETFREFQEKMIELESKQRSVGLLNIYKDILVGEKNPMVALIKNYPIPDSVDYIVQFMIYATTCIEDTRSKDVALAWYSKMKQMYMKARMSFPNDPAFKEIESMYLAQKAEYDWA